jgi:hypothetical protein
MRPGFQLGVGCLVALPVFAAQGGSGSGGPGPLALVICAPGYPGSTAEAQAVMDGFASAVARGADLAPGTLVAVYHETEAGGAARASQPDTGFVLAPLAFFLKHEAELRLVARAQAVRQGGEPNEVWSLLAGKGRVETPSSLSGWEIQSPVAYAPAFVRGPVLGGWGRLPESATLLFSGAVLTGLRKAAAGEKVAVLLDEVQSLGVAGLPLAKDLQVVTRSGPLPAYIVSTVRDRVAPPRAGAILKALLALAQRPEGAPVLANLRLSRFVPLEEGGMKQVRAAYAAANAAP